MVFQNKRKRIHACILFTFICFVHLERHLKILLEYDNILRAAVSNFSWDSPQNNNITILQTAIGKSCIEYCMNKNASHTIYLISIPSNEYYIVSISVILLNIEKAKNLRIIPG